LVGNIRPAVPGGALFYINIFSDIGHWNACFYDNNIAYIK
jgi:hypothetical protein